MKQALIQRVILGVILIIAVMVLNFFLLQAAPGDVVDAMLAEAGGETLNLQLGLENNMAWINLYTFNL